MSKKSIRVALFILLDIISVFLTLFLSLLLRVGYAGITETYYQNMWVTGTIMSVITVAVYIFARLYNTLWEYASVDEVIKIIFSNLGIMVAVFIVDSILGIKFPRSMYPISIMVLTILTGGSRFAYRILRHIKILYLRRINKDLLVNTIIIGSDQGIISIVKYFRTSGNEYIVPVAIVDTEKGRVGNTIENIPILGTLDDLEQIIVNKNARMVLLTGNHINNKQITGILEVCQRNDCELKKYDSITLSNDKRNIVSIKVDDLLGRDKVELDTDDIASYLNQKTIFVIGGGGSIGSELVRQIAGYNPRKVIIIDIIENNAYLLYRELLRRFPGLNIVIEIASIRDKKRLDTLFQKHKPEIVFHAAAHKHVPLMETSPCEAIKNNVGGTINIAECADKHKTEKMILISTDKAVNPTNIMGASKRIAEMVIQSYDKCSETDFCAVRFGNVLNSSGSVIPLFKKQIEEGGPVTVTHRDITRFFMTISEACLLVMQAGALAAGGEIFILNMGEQVRISDLAENMIRMQGLEPGLDIQIKYTGLRKGEKLYEELLLTDEDVETRHEKIFITKCGHTDLEYIKERTRDMCSITNDKEKIRAIVKELVPEYQMPES